MRTQRLVLMANCKAKPDMNHKFHVVKATAIWLGKWVAWITVTNEKISKIQESFSAYIHTADKGSDLQWTQKGGKQSRICESLHHLCSLDRST